MGQRLTSFHAPSGPYRASSASGSSSAPSCSRQIYSPSLAAVGQYMSRSAWYVLASRVSMTPSSSAALRHRGSYSSRVTARRRGITQRSRGCSGLWLWVV